MTPFEIRILLHYYVSPDEPEERDAPIFVETIRRFLVEGLIEQHPDCDETCSRCRKYQTTARGDAYCEALKRVPLPVQAWLIPEIKA